MAPYDDDDVLIQRSSHPVTTTLLIVNILVLGLAIWINAKHLSQYVNPETRSNLKEFQVTATSWAKKEFKSSYGTLDEDEGEDRTE
ncbi:MAG: hypothetical protein ACYS22_05835 [Planctomycetota bacterium]|jgi:hypothetical protein